MWSKIGTFILDYIVKRIMSWATALFRQKNKVEAQEKEATKAAEKFEEVVKDETKTREERKNAETDFLNS